MTTPPNDIILFHYPFSPYVRRVIWYLQLRGIEFAQCIQPSTLPRPDLHALGIHYRRIPLLSLGRDVYLDSRLILRTLETSPRFPTTTTRRLSSPGQEGALETMFENWTVEGGVFALAGKLLPPEMPVLRDEKFKRDREDYSGRSWDVEDVRRMRPEGVVGMRACWDLLERWLGDGREWIAATEEVGMADVHAVWPFHWLVGLQDALPPEIFGKEQYPRTHAWIERFSSAVESAKAKAPKPPTLKGEEAVQHILQADYIADEGTIDPKDPLGLKKGQDVELWPTDTGFTHKDRGRLLSLTKDEVVIAVQSKVDGKEIRLHAPRAGFRVQAVQVGDAKL